MATSNILTQNDIQGYLSRLKNTTPDPMTLLKQGGVAQVPQPQAPRPAAPSQPSATPSAISAVQGGGVTGLGGAIHSLPGINASNMTLGQNPIQSTQTPVRQAAQTSLPTQQPVQPVAQASYQGGQALPAIGTPEYAQAQALANRPATVSAPAQTPTQSSSQIPQVPGLFQQALLGQQAFGSSPNPLATNAYAGLLGLGYGNLGLGQKAYDIASQAGQRISDIGGQGARGEAGYLTTGTSPVAEGNAAVLANTTAAQQQAVAQGANAQLSGLDRSLTAQNQAQNAINAAGGLGISTGAQQLGALQGVSSASAPVSQFGVLTSPVTGQPISPGTTPGSAAFQGGFIRGQQQAGVSAAQMNVANTAAKGIQGTIQQYIQSNPDLNASPLAIGNAAQQWLQGKQLADPRYQTLFNYLNEYTNTLAPILGVGGDPTNLKTQIAQGFINAQASGQSISQVLNDIGNLADQKLQNIISAGQGGGQVAGATPQGGTPTSFGSEW